MKLTADLFFHTLSVCTQALKNKILSDICSCICVLHCLLTYFHIEIFVCAFFVNTNHFVWSILSRLDDFAISTIANIFLHERLTIPEAYSEPSQTSKKVLFANLVFNLQSLTNICKILHPRCSSGFSIHLCILFPRIFLNTFRKRTFAGKK